MLVLYGIEKVSERTAYAIHVNLLLIILINLILVGLNCIEGNELLLDVLLGSVLRSMLKGEILSELLSLQVSK